MSNRIVSTAALLLLTAALGQAQTSTKVVPGSFDDVDGNGSTIGFVGHDAGRYQQVWTGSAIASTVAQIREVAFRADAPQRATNAFTVANVTVELGSTSAAPGGLSKTFATNRGSSMTQVFKGTLNVPAYSGGQTVAPWDIKVPLASPFAYIVSTGNLLIDATMGTAAGKRSGLSVDATGAGGAAYRFGTRGKMSRDNLNFVFSSDPKDLHPGGNFSIATTTTFGAYPGALILGGSNTNWGSIKLPFDLTVLGAPGNSLYVSVDFTAPHNFQRTFIGWASTLQIFVPVNPTLAGAEVFAQSLLVDANSNPAGVVMSDAFGIRLASDNKLRLDAVWHESPASATGKPVLFSGGGVVTRFTGTFQ